MIHSEFFATENLTMEKVRDVGYKQTFPPFSWFCPQCFEDNLHHQLCAPV
jgi:hypothetical protein